MPFRPARRLLLLTLLLIAASVPVVLWAAQALGVLALLWGLAALLALADLLTLTPPRRISVTLSAPDQGFVGHDLAATVTLSARHLPRGMALRLILPPEISAAVPVPPSDPGAQVTLAAPLRLTRRGVFTLGGLALKYPSRFGLWEAVLTQRSDQKVTVLPDVSPVSNGLIQAQMLPLMSGQKDMRLRGEGSEFHQLVEFSPGMDPRQIDWKRSARQRRMVVRETRVERNHQIILALDCGRLMAERVGGLPKLDRAINAALAMCWAGGLGGDLVGLYAFDSRPRLFVPPTPGRAAFARLRQHSTALDYQTVETNHTLGLSHLSGRLKRRSLVIVFSDFTDTITAGLMVENLMVMARHHLVLYVALRDPAVVALAQPDGISMAAIARSVAAQQMLDERAEVLDRLARMGVLCLDTTHEHLTPELISRYIEIKSREMI